MFITGQGFEIIVCNTISTSDWPDVHLSVTRRVCHDTSSGPCITASAGFCTEQSTERFSRDLAPVQSATFSQCLVMS